MLAQIVISMDTVVRLFIWVLVVGAIFSLLYWLSYYIEKTWPIMQPFTKVSRVVLVVAGVLFLIGVLLNFAGYPLIVLR